jgi:hypothetical protein
VTDLPLLAELRQSLDRRLEPDAAVDRVQLVQVDPLDP